ncbi:MAG: carbamoyltransferase HypF [Selenomonadaceae bacterium]|nr:carbamoyltransferase HypF [Selenomonadaceae bacterium]
MEVNFLVYNIKVFGIVQGVGFRPFIDRLAATFNINGTVANKGSYVEIFAQGSDYAVQNFCDAITKNPPPRSTILDINISKTSMTDDFNDFQIIESEHETGNIFVSPDIAICDLCKTELFDKNNRRYLHPFINCTACGPRLTILKNMPYDRERTSMNKFPMCNDCSEEYFNPNSRRYDAQPVCCNECGPEVYILDGNERGAEAIKRVRRVIKDGGIAAIKGIGGFHIACDSTNFETVNRLRKLKHRPQKPFAVMIKERQLINNAHSTIYKFIDNHQKQILLIDKSWTIKVAENVAPYNHKLGVMLPYTPLHLLIFNYPDDIVDFPKVLIMTSGNISGSPIVITDDEARRDLSKICDVILSNNRDILIRADDSVIDFINDEPYMIRRSRGYAPLPILIRNEKLGMRNYDSVLAIGGELKNTFCLSKGDLFYLSPYIGDMTSLQSFDILKNSISRMSDLLEIKPQVIACDLHPRYQTTKIAEIIASELDVSLIKVQHHYAHVLSCMAENNFTDKVIGVAFDGTGYGTDGTIWGGEFLVSDLNGFERAASIAPFIQAGGDKSSVEGWRIAIAIILDAFKDVDTTKKIINELNIIDEDKITGQLFLLQNNINCIKSTSAGRLFDAVSAILGLCSVSTFEGEAAMKLQFAAESFKTSSNRNCDYPLNKLFNNQILCFNDLISRRLSGDSVNQLAYEFHIGLADYIVNTCIKIRNTNNISTVALTGGVFQNSLLLSLTADNLKSYGFNVLCHKLIPANDGGLCLGQAVAANGIN